MFMDTFILLETSYTIDELIKFGLMIMGIFGFYEVIMKIMNRITARHDREQAWDNGAEERKKITENFNNRLDELESKVNENHIDTKNELFILTECMRAVLDGLHQQGCNGEVTIARQKLDDYIVLKAHEKESVQW